MANDITTSIREVRRRAGLTQEEFAIRLEYSRATVATTETGKPPSSKYLRRMKERFPNDYAVAFNEGGDESEEDVTAACAGEDDAQDMFTLRCTKRPDLTGEWHALWESTADNEEVINSERLSIHMKRTGRFIIENLEPSPENPKGGYLWRAEGNLFDSRHLLSTYIAREPNVISKGTLYLVLHNSGAFIEGQWIGCNYDGDWARGLVVIARERNRLPELLNRLRDNFPPLPYNQRKLTKE